MVEVNAKNLLPVVLMLIFALTRWPGLLPWNFSAAYAMMFCAGVFFPKRLVWWLPFVIMAVSDTLLNFYHHAKYPDAPLFSVDLIGNYLAYFAIVWLGRKFGPKAGFLSLLAGGLLGAILFYVVTNSLSWLFNPFNNLEYTRNLAGWFIALTKGTAGHAQTWEFFRNTMMSAGLFTALFAGAMKIMDAIAPEEEEKPAPEPTEEQPEEAKT